MELNKFNSHHYVTGSENPVPKIKSSSDKMIFFNMRFCPFAHTTALTLIAKNIDCEVVNIHLKKKPEWFLETVNPLGLVPALILPDGTRIIESSICNDYLEETFEGAKLTHQDPGKKASDKSVRAFFEHVVRDWMALMYSEPGTEKAEQLTQNYLASYARIEKILREKNTKYFFGNEKPGIVDYMIWPTMERYQPSIQLRPECKLDSNDFSHILAWKGRMLQDPVVKAYLVPDEIHVKLFKAYLKGKEFVVYDDWCKELKQY